MLDSLFLSFFFAHTTTTRDGSVPSIGAVNADPIGLCRVLPEILNVPQNVASAVLGDEVAKVCADAHVRNRSLMVAPLHNRPSFE